MSQPFGIDTEALGNAEGPFQELSTRLTSLSREIQGRVSALGDVWGDDDSGKGFVEKYGPARDQLLESLDQTSEVVKSTADGVATMAHGFAQTEDSNHEAMQGLLRQVREPVDAATPSTPGGTLSPTESTPRVLMNATRRTPAEGETQPLMRARRMEADVAPDQVTNQDVPLTPTYTAARRDEALPAEARELGTPLQPAHMTRAVRDEAVPAEPRMSARRVDAATPGEPALPTAPGLPLDAAIPGEPGVPASAAAATPGVPAEPLQPRHYDTPMQPLQPTQTVPAEPALPRQAFEVDSPRVEALRPTRGDES